MQKIDPELQARTLVGQYYNDRREDINEQPEITLSEIHIRSFHIMNSAWRAIIETDIPDGRIYEVEYSPRSHRLSISVYQKLDKINLSM